MSGSSFNANFNLNFKLYLTDKCNKCYTDKSQELDENYNKVSECAGEDWSKWDECQKKYPYPCETDCNISQEDNDSCMKCHQKPDIQDCFNKCNDIYNNCNKDCGWETASQEKRMLHFKNHFSYICFSKPIY